MDDRNGQGGEDAQGAGSEPGSAPGDDQGGAAELNDDREAVVEPGGFEPELAHLCHAAGKIQELGQPAAPEREGQKNPSGELGDPARQNGVNPAWRHDRSSFPLTLGEEAS